MNRAKIITYIQEQWEQQGECASCGWHAALSEYDLGDIDIDYRRNRIELPCLSKDEDTHGHRGVRIYFDEATMKSWEEPSPLPGVT